jgi:DNA-binding NtrC family response regulator
MTRDVQQKSILLVDDEQDELANYAEMLQGWGYRVIAAQNAESALAQMQPDIDAVVTDYQMPDMDGLTFLDALKRVRPEVPVVMLTAHGGIATYLNAVGKGAFEYINKPVNRAELKRILNAALYKKGEIRDAGGE